MGFGNLFAGEALLGIAFVVRIKLGHSTIRARRFARTYVTDEGLPQQVVDLLHGPVIKPIVVRCWPYDFRRRNRARVLTLSGRATPADGGGFRLGIASQPKVA